MTDHRAAPTSDSWEKSRGGLQKHPNGSIDHGCNATTTIALLRNGERRTFKQKADAKVWIENNGVFPPGYVPAEKRGE